MNISFDSLALDSNLITLLDQSLSQAQSWLNEFAQRPDFALKMAIAFGDSFNPDQNLYYKKNN